MADQEEWADALAEMARDLNLLDTRSIARRVTVAVPELVPWCEEAAMCLRDRHGGTVPVAATGEPAALADRLQHEAGDGPCPAAIRDGVVTAGPASLDDSRMPAFQRVAQATGLSCMLAIPLLTGEETLGALTLYGRSPDVLTPRATATGRLVATYAALALAGAVARQRIAEFTEALRTSRLIGMAVGIIMVQRRVTPEQAFDVLRRTSQRRNRKIRELAAVIVDTGDVPG